MRSASRSRPAWRAGLGPGEGIPVGPDRREDIDHDRAVRTGHRVMGQVRWDAPRPARTELAPLPVDREGDAAFHAHPELLVRVTVLRHECTRASSTTARLALAPATTRACTVSPQTSSAGTSPYPPGSTCHLPADCHDPASVARYASRRADLEPDRPSLHPRQAGPVARSALARPAGTERAMRAMEHLQLDPLHHRAQPRPDAAQPRHRLPPRRLGDADLRAAPVLRLGRLAGRPADGRAAALARDHAPRARQPTDGAASRASTPPRSWRCGTVLRERGTVTNRDFTMAARTRADSYRGRKDSAVALYYLWRTGEVMVHPARALRARLRPDRSGRAGRPHPGEQRGRGRRLPARKMVAAQGLTSFVGVAGTLLRAVRAAELKAWRTRGLPRR